MGYPTIKTKVMPATHILTLAPFSHLILSLFFKQIDFICLNIGWDGGIFELLINEVYDPFVKCEKTYIN